MMSDAMDGRVALKSPKWRCFPTLASEVFCSGTFREMMIGGSNG